MSLSNPVAILFDINGNPIGVSSSMPLPVGALGHLIAAVDSSNFVQYLQTISGSLKVTGSVQSSVTFPSSLQTYTSAPQGVTGSVAVYTQGAQQVSGSVSVTGGVSVFTQGAQGVTGSVNVYTSGLQGISGSVTVGAWGTNVTASIQGVPGGIPVIVAQSGPVSVSGSVATYTQGAQLVSGTVQTWTSAPQAVTGAYQSGSVASAPIFPVLVGGLDPTGVVRPIRLDPQGRATNQVSGSSVSSVNASTGNQTLLASNAARVGAIIFNDSTANLFLKFGITASTTSFTVLIGGKGYYEIPFSYTGQLDAVWSTNVGAARITELS